MTAFAGLVSSILSLVDSGKFVPTKLFNPFQSGVPFPKCLKTSENQRSGAQKGSQDYVGLKKSVNF